MVLQGVEMEVVVDEPNRIIEIWLTSFETEQREANLMLAQLYKKSSEHKYKAVTFCSGKGNLENFTAALLSKNYRKILAGKM